MIPTDPDDLLTIPLAEPEGTPPEKARSLSCRAMSLREVKAYRRILAEADTAKTDDEAVAVYSRALNMSVRGWSNVTGDDGEPAPFAPDAWDVFTGVKLRRIAEMLPYALAVAECDRPLSQSPLGSGRGKSAPAVAAANAQTPQPSTPPSSSNA